MLYQLTYVLILRLTGLAESLVYEDLILYSSGGFTPITYSSFSTVV